MGFMYFSSPVSLRSPRLKCHLFDHGAGSLLPGRPLLDAGGFVAVRLQPEVLVSFRIVGLVEALGATTWAVRFGHPGELLHVGAEVGQGDRSANLSDGTLDIKDTSSSGGRREGIPQRKLLGFPPSRQGVEYDRG